MKLLESFKHYLLFAMGWWMMVSPLVCISNLDRLGSMLGVGPNLGHEIGATSAYRVAAIVVVVCGYFLWVCSLVAWRHSVVTRRTMPPGTLGSNSAT